MKKLGIVSFGCLIALMFWWFFRPNVQYGQLQVDVQYQGQSLQCGQTFSVNQFQWQVQKLAWFVSQPEIKIAGAWQPLVLADNQWQQHNTALLRMLDENCQTQNLNVSLLAELPENAVKVTALRFNLGVPFHLNHQNPLTQPAPLNLSEMFWSWQSGHKFLRLDMQSSENGWAYHLGSLGCLSSSRVRPPEQSCIEPNVVQVQLNNINLTGKLVFELDKLLSDVDLLVDRGCVHHGAEEQSCELLYNNLAGSFRWAD